MHTLGSAHVRRLVWERRQRGLRQSLVCLLADEMSWRQEIHSPRSLSVLQPISNFLCARSRSEPMSSRHKLLKRVQTCAAASECACGSKGNKTVLAPSHPSSAIHLLPIPRKYYCTPPTRTTKTDETFAG